jgi:G3E family GTPase
VRNFVYRARRPFDPAKFDKFIKEPWPRVIRAKVHFWLATRPQWLGEISQAGAIIRTEALGFWWASVPAERWPDDAFWRKRLRANWNDIYGDRRRGKIAHIERRQRLVHRHQIRPPQTPAADLLARKKD